jgi:integrase
LRWRHYIQRNAINDKNEIVNVRFFQLESFKGKDRREDGARTRDIPVNEFLGRILAIWYNRRHPKPDDFIFRNRYGGGWTRDAFYTVVKKARKRAGLHDDGREKIVPYTFRHTAATRAALNGVRDRRLATVMGHANTRSTERYLHFDSVSMNETIEQATRRVR